MKRMTMKIICLVVAGVLFTTGCEEESQIDTRKSRLVATENMRLKEELERCEKEIENQKKLVEKCLQEKKASEEKIQEEINNLTENALKDLEENIKLREENEKLKARVQQLETIIQQLGKEPPKIEEPPTPQPL